MKPATKDPNFYKKIRAIADKSSPALKKIILDAAGAVDEKTAWNSITVALAEFDGYGIDPLVEQLAWDQFDAELLRMNGLLFDVFGTAGVATSAELSTTFGAAVGWDITYPNSLDWIKKFSAARVKYVSSNSREAIRGLILDSYENQVTPQQTAKLIRNHIGLDPRRSQALINYRQGLADGGIYSPQQIDKMVGQYAKRLLKDRAETIARTETISAANAGFYHDTLQAADRGIIDREKYELAWLASVEKRTCDRCLAINGETCPIGGTFPWGDIGPPLHPRCRCSIVLVKIYSRSYF